MKTGNAVLASDMFTFDGSLAKGRKMTADFSKLMLRAYNAEADNCVRSLRSGNVRTAKARLERAMAAIEKLGAIMEMRVNPDYHQVRVEELELTADFQMKVQEERERAREERAELREQQKVEQELAAERERLDKERAHYVGVLEQLRAKGDEAAAAELEGRLNDIDAAIEANDYRAANIRAGYIYVISNVGALGPERGEDRHDAPPRAAGTASGSSAMRRCRSCTTPTRCSSPRTPSRWRTSSTRRSLTGG